MEKQKQNAGRGFGRFLFSVAGAAICLQGGPLLGLGVVVPNGDDANQYYQVQDTGLYRFDCPEGVVPTGNSCDEHKTLLGNYPKIRASIARELGFEVGKLEVAIDGEIRSLKEADPEVKAMRTLLRQYATQSDQLALSIVKTEQHIRGAESNLGLIAVELKTIADELKKDPSEEQLKRLLEQQKRYLSLKSRYQAQKTALEKELTTAKESKEGLVELTQSTNVKLAAYMKALIVTSPALAKLKAAKANYDRERVLLPELDARVSEKVAYELKLWEEPGSSELFARMLKHVGICQAQ